MANNVNEPKDARLEAIESIQEYLESFHSVSELYERAAKATACLMHLEGRMADEEKKLINDMVQDYICVLELLKPFNEKGE